MNVIFKRPFRIKIDQDPKVKTMVNFPASKIPKPLPDHCAENWFVKHQIEEGYIVVLPAPKAKLDPEAAAKMKAKQKADAEAAAKAKAEEDELEAELEAEAEAKAAKTKSNK